MGGDRRSDFQLHVYGRLSCSYFYIWGRVSVEGRPGLREGGRGKTFTFV